MRSRWNFKVCPQEIQGHAQRLLAPVLSMGKGGPKCTVAVLMHVVLIAAARMWSLFSTCLSLQTISDQSVRQGLRACLPKRRRYLEEKITRALLKPLPKTSGRRPRALAVDRQNI